MDGRLDYANYHWGRILNSNNAIQGLLYLDGRNSQNTFIKSRLTFKL